MNKKRIKITYIKDFGKTHEWFCDTILRLRKARKVGDEEVVNHYVLGLLREHKSYGEIDFIEF